MKKEEEGKGRDFCVNRHNKNLKLLFCMIMNRFVEEIHWQCIKEMTSAFDALEDLLDGDYSCLPQLDLYYEEYEYNLSLPNI